MRDFFLEQGRDAPNGAGSFHHHLGALHEQNDRLRDSLVLYSDHVIDKLANNLISHFAWLSNRDTVGNRRHPLRGEKTASLE